MNKMNQGRMGRLAWLPGLVLVAWDTQAATIQFSTSFDTTMVYGPPNTVPSISGVAGQWLVPQFDPALGTLTSVSYSLTATLQSTHAVTSNNSSQSFNLDVNSTFDFTIFGVSGTTSLTPGNTVSTTTAAIGDTYTEIPATGSMSDQQTTTVAANSSGYVGNGTLLFQLVAGLSGTAPSGYHSNNQDGSVSGLAFVDNAKVYLVEEWSGYQLLATAQVTYTYQAAVIPESSTQGLTALVFMALGWEWRRRGRGHRRSDA